MAYNLQRVMAQFPADILARYDFSKAVYVHALTPITGIVCSLHGEFQQYAAQLRKPGGAGCPACGQDLRNLARRMPPDEFVCRAEKRHPGKYDYSCTNFVNTTTKVQVRCPKHGEFTITPANHIYAGQGCPTCGGVTRGFYKNETTRGVSSAATSIAKHRLLFESRARAVHGDLYDYSAVDYRGARKPVEIRCHKHGAFWQMPHKHVGQDRQGCPSCGQKSAGEEEVAKFIGIFAPVVRRDRAVIKPKEIDIYLPEHRLAVEYCGAYYHSAGSRDELAFATTRHAEKHALLESQGIRLITLFDQEWAERQRPVRRLLRTAIGKLRGKLMARKCEVQRVAQADARAFFDRYHVQGGKGSGEHYGLYWHGKLVACMRFALGANDRGAKVRASGRDWVLGRYATRVNVVGGASRLFSAFVAEFRPEKVKSFSDNRFFTGGMYEKLGFVLEEVSDPDYVVWHIKTGILSKSAWQRRNIPARLKEVGSDQQFTPETDPRSERDMTFLAGARVLYDCGKKRWVWRPADGLQNS